MEKQMDFDLFIAFNQNKFINCLGISSKMCGNSLAKANKFRLWCQQKQRVDGYKINLKLSKMYIEMDQASLGCFCFASHSHSVFAVYVFDTIKWLELHSSKNKETKQPINKQ